MGRIKLLIILLLLANSNLVLAGGQARSIAYTFDYTAVGISGGVSEAGPYHVVSYSDQSNSASVSSSVNYNISPLVGGTDGESSVSDWVLYN